MRGSVQPNCVCLVATVVRNKNSGEFLPLVGFTIVVLRIKLLNRAVVIGGSFVIFLDVAGKLAAICLDWDRLQISFGSFWVFVLFCGEIVVKFKLCGTFEAHV